MKKGLIYFFAIFFALIITTLFLPYSCSRGYDKNGEFDKVMEDISNEKKVTQIAMLGAHDAFSGDINYLSRANTNESGIVTNGFVGKIAKGLIVRFSKAQKGSAKDLLYGGVRYLDVRVTLINDEFYTCHGYVSNKLDYYLVDVIDFLETHPTEFVIFDIQAYYTENGQNRNLPDSDYEKLRLHLEEYKNKNGKSLLDFVRYDSFNDKLNDLTLGKVTNNKTNGGVIILAKNSSVSAFYSRDDDANSDPEREYTSIRSFWHENNSTNQILNAIDGEYEFCKTQNYSGIFVVNQAQKTAFIMNTKIIRSLFGWSLTKMAVNFNKELTSDKDRFEKWLSEMPIFMVDYALSSKGDFNKLANEYIMEFNKK